MACHDIVCLFLFLKNVSIRHFYYSLMLILNSMLVVFTNIINVSVFQNKFDITVLYLVQSRYMCTLVLKTKYVLVVKFISLNCYV